MHVNQMSMKAKLFTIPHIILYPCFRIKHVVVEVLRSEYCGQQETAVDMIMVDIRYLGRWPKKIDIK